MVPELPSEGQTAVSQESGVSSGLGVSICYSHVNPAATRWQDRSKNSRQMCKVRKPAQPYFTGGRYGVVGWGATVGKNLRHGVYFSTTDFNSAPGNEVSGDRSWYLECMVLKA